MIITPPCKGVMTYELIIYTYMYMSEESTGKLTVFM